MEEPAQLAPGCAEEPLTPPADLGADGGGGEDEKSMLARRHASSQRMSSFLLASGGAADAEDVAHEGVDRSRAELLFEMLDVDGDKRVRARPPQQRARRDAENARLRGPLLRAARACGARPSREVT